MFRVTCFVIFCSRVATTFRVATKFNTSTSCIAFAGFLFKGCGEWGRGGAVRGGGGGEERFIGRYCWCRFE